LNRKQRLKSCLDLKNVITGADGALSPDATTEALNALNQGDLYSVATKNDVDQLIKKIFARMNIMLSKNIEHYFIELLTLAKYSPWFTEWDKMIKVVSSN